MTIAKMFKRRGEMSDTDAAEFLNELEAMLYEPMDDPYPAALLAQALVADVAATTEPEADADLDEDDCCSVDRYEALHRVLHGLVEVPPFPALKRVGRG